MAESLQRINCVPFPLHNSKRENETFERLKLIFIDCEANFSNGLTLNSSPKIRKERLSNLSKGIFSEVQVHGVGIQKIFVG